jgi:hypothetical protein
MDKTIKSISNTRYIVVAFWEGVGYTYQMDNKLHFFFHHPAIVYKKLGHAINRANNLSNTYLNDKVCVFKVELDERLSCDQYKKWCNDKSRMVYEI